MVQGVRPTTVDGADGAVDVVVSRAVQPAFAHGARPFDDGAGERDASSGGTGRRSGDEEASREYGGGNERADHDIPPLRMKSQLGSRPGPGSISYEREAKENDFRRKKT
jgi:hypothetical protein